MKQKFRAWQKNTKTMIDLQKITPLALAIDPTIVGARMGVYVPDDDMVIVMQFTGIQDKKGVDVYEGDITEIICLSGERLHCVVEWNTRLAQWRMVPTEETQRKGYVPLGWDLDRPFRVIGNIYENGEVEI